MFRFRFHSFEKKKNFFVPVIKTIEEEVKKIITTTPEEKVAKITIRNHVFAGEYGDKYKSQRSGIKIHKNGKDYYLLNKLEDTQEEEQQEEEQEQKPSEETVKDTATWEVEFQMPAKEYSIDYTTISGVVADDITDETANGGEDFDGHDRTIVLYFVGCVNKDGTEKRLETPYLMDWADQRTTQNETMQAYLKEQGFEPYYNAPGACYNIDTDAKAIITAAYSVNLIFKIAHVKDAVNNATVTA